MKYTGRDSRFAIAGLAAGVLVLFALPAARAAEPEEPATVRIKEEAYVKGPKVYLSDLVEVEERELRERLAKIEVSSAARPGDSKMLNASLVEARLEHAGVDMDTVAVESPSSVRATTMHLDISPEMLVASLKTFIEAEMPWDPKVTEIDIPLPRQELMAPEGDLVIDWRASPQYKYLGLSNFRGDVLVDGTLYRTVVLRGSVETYQEIVVASTDISRGRPVTTSQLEMEMVALSRAPDGAITETADVIGLVARKTIFPGQPITSRNVEPRRAIKRNQMVPVEIRSSNIHIQNQARAMMDGKVGDLIVCANPLTKEEFQGVVRKDGVVEVR